MLILLDILSHLAGIVQLSFIIYHSIVAPFTTALTIFTAVNLAEVSKCHICCLP